MVIRVFLAGQVGGGGGEGRWCSIEKDVILRLRRFFGGGILCRREAKGGLVSWDSMANGELAFRKCSKAVRVRKKKQSYQRASHTWRLYLYTFLKPLRNPHGLTDTPAMLQPQLLSNLHYHSKL